MSQARARALVDHVAEYDGEVSFERGDVVVVDLGRPAPDGFISVSVPATGRKGIAPMTGLLAIEGPQSTLLASFDGENEGELSANEGDVVTLLTTEEEVPNGWVLAAIGEAVGFLPETYITPVTVEKPPRVILADFDGQHESELSVRQGDLVLLMKQVRDRRAMAA